MSLSKKVRFEVFKRDDFQCGYCGKTPPGVVLEVDHIEPISKGGKDDISNLITACFDCNRGKRDIPLSNIPLKLKDNLMDIKEREEQINEYRKYMRKVERRIQKDIAKIDLIYTEYFIGYQLSDTFKKVTVRKFIKALPLHEVEESMRSAISKLHNRREEVTKYFCGICWNKIRGGN